MISVLLSSIVQVAIVAVIAGVFWLFFGRKRSGFLRYVGLIPARWHAVLLGITFGVASAVALLSIPAVRAMAGGEQSVAGSVAGQAPAVAIGSLVVLAIFKTAFSEELFFRGFLGKRLISWLGFWAGNTVQAALFGAIHLLVLLSPQATALSVTIIVAFSAVSGWINGWLNERMGGGSILPSWAAHAAANTTSYLALWFLANHAGS